MSDSKKRILIVEDEKPMAKVLKMKLEHSGFEAETAGDGKEAMGFVEAGPFDLILLDLVMPNMDGFSFLTSLRKRNIQTPVIVSSNLSQAEDVSRAKELGAVDYFVKSDISITEVVERITRILNES